MGNCSLAESRKHTQAKRAGGQGGQARSIEALEARILLSVLYTQADFDRMRQGVQSGAQPWAAGWNALVSDGYSQAGWNPRPLQTVIRGGTGENYNQMVIDMERAYQTAVRWKVSGDVTYANQAVMILNAWSYTMTTLTGNSDRFLASGLYGFGWAAAADIMKSYSGWADVQHFKDYLVNIYYPMQHDFLVNHNTAYITNYWANWDLANIEGMMGVGLFADRPDLYQEAVDYLYNGKGNGALDKMAYYRHPGNLMQWQESGRDQGHTVLGMQLFGHIAQMAWNQGLDLFSCNNNQFLAAAEYVAKYNLGHDVPYVTYSWGNGQSGAWSTQTVISGGSRGDMDVGFELIYAHYVELLGMAAPYTTARLAARGTEWRGSGDEFGFGTLTYRLPPVATATLTPTGLTAAEKGRGNVQLDWFGTANATGYNVYRSTSSDGLYVKIASNVTDLLTYTDRNLPAGLYYYKVTGIVGGGETGFSSVVSATATTSLHTQLLFNENSGTTAGDATDNGHTGTLVNGATWTTGRSGSAVLLDGVNDYVSLPAGVVADVNDFTISAWVYLNDSRTWSRVFDFGDDRGRWMYLTPRNGGGVVEFATSTTYGYNKQAVTGTAALPTNQWVHVAVTLSERTARLYVNGALVGAHVTMDFPPAEFQSTKWNWLGRSQFAADLYLNGRIDDFQIYRGAMTSGEIYTLATGVAAPAAPVAPGSLAAAGVPGNQVNLSWAAVSSATSYTVYRATTAGGPYTTIGTLVKTTSFTDMSLMAGARYYYAVAAANNGGEGVLSVEKSVVALPPMPGAPTNLSASAVSASAIGLTWTAGTNADTYAIRRATSTGGPYTVVATGVSGATYTDTGRTAGTTYYYIVSSTNAAGTSGSSNEASATPSDLRALLKFNETSGTTAADATGNGFGGTLVNGPAWASGQINNGLNLDGTDDHVTLPTGVVNGLTAVTIAAWVNLDTVSTWARVFDFGTSTSNYMFLSPKGGSNVVRFAIRTAAVAEQQINGAAALPTGAWVYVAVTLAGSVGILYVNGTEVGRNSAMTLNPSSLGATTLNYIGRSQFADPYLDGRVDEFRIYTRALSATEVNTLSKTLLPATPSPVAAMPGNGQISVAWVSAAGAASYAVARSTIPGGPYATVAAGLTATGYVDTAVTAGTTYYYTVTSVNATGQSAPSIEVSATPTVQATVVARELFYGNSVFDTAGGHEAAIATDKTALLPGQMASFANYSSYSRGITGVIIDLDGTVGAVSAADFVFKTGNSADPATWGDAPAPTSVAVLAGAGFDGGTRVEIVWADNVIQNTWLQVTLRATAASNLAADDVFYFGNAIGESGNSTGDAAVTTADVLAARGHLSASPVAITNAWDYNRDGVVSSADMAVAQGNLTAGVAVLILLAAPAIPAMGAVTTSEGTETLVLGATGGVATGPTTTVAGTTTSSSTGVAPRRSATVLQRVVASISAQAHGVTALRKVLERWL